jgi:hypothetical protein
MVFYQQAARLPVIDGAKCNSYPAFFLAFEHQVLGRILGRCEMVCASLRRSVA